MREIKFRAWDVNRKEMNHSCFFIYCNGKVYHDSGWDSVVGNEIEQGSYEIMQFTGLKDKNSREIYEGDILRMDIYGGMNVFVVWRGVGWEFWKSLEGPSPIGNHCYTKEVIGNIYENEELLKCEK